MTNEQQLFQMIEEIVPADEQAAGLCQKRWDAIAKPLHALGWMEEAVDRIAAAQHDPQVRTENKILVPMCADNGIVEEGVTQTGQEVTAVVAENFLSGNSCASIFCRIAGADIRPIDIGMAADTLHVQRRKAAYGTKNFAREPAMRRETACEAILTGLTLAGELKEEGYDLIAAGEMGIGNTTTASAVASALLHAPAEEMTGRGAGLSDAGLQKKIRVIAEAIDRWDLYEQDPLTVLSAVGGLDLAGIAGLVLGGAYYHLPVVLDGFISCVGALIAVRLAPAAAGYLLASHVSKEPAAGRILKELNLKPALDAGMCLGEGSGAAAVFPLIDMAVQAWQTMPTFEDVSIEPYHSFDNSN